MFPSSCECSNSTDDDGDECMFVETTDQSIYSDVSYFLQLINVSARVFFVSSDAVIKVIIWAPFL